MQDLDKQIKSLEKKLNRVAKDATPKAYASAVNKTASKIKTDVVRKVAKDANIRVKDVSPRVYVRRASARKGVAAISFYSKPVNATKTNFSKLRKGFKVAGEVVPRSFFARGRNNRRHYIYQRKGKARTPIRMVTIRISRAVNRYAEPAIAQKMRTDFPRILKSEFNARIKGYVS